MMKLAFLRLTLSAAALLAAAPATAQDAPDEDGGWTVSIGPGAAVRPKFPGAEELEAGFWPVIDFYRTERGPSFETPDEGFGFGIVGNDKFRVGPTIQIQSGRDEEDAILGIGDVGTTIEGGAFFESYLSDNLRLRGEVRKGFGGHKGLVGDVGGDFIMGDIDDFQFSIGPRVRLANKRYVRAFYGVNPAQSALTGLPVYDVDGGLHSAGALAFANYRLSDQLRLQAYGRYDRLLGDAKDSPLVLSDVGSRNQYEAGIGIAYSFRVR
ncbi:MAG TPA: MipA/OmpV family protein [Allosphingosinicella sp.]|uniref:MipA/OmpV family protein n=1 Tax=Allosphingosinicella sp. TaxID=2823234 RepID=UPI002ED9825A